MLLKRTPLLLGLLLGLLACQAVSGSPAVPQPAARPTSTPVLAVPADDTAYELFDESPAPDRFTIVRIGQSGGGLAGILRLEAHKAVILDRDPYVEFFTGWCPPCKALKENLDDERMIAAFDGTYIIQLDLDQWEKELPGLGFYVPGVPAFYEIDEQGQPTGRMITGGAWGEDIPANIAPPMKEFFDQGRSD
ncbi:MAG: hypothetical protein JXA13_10285 [Anaerolineales bacterium]|nr:hypothetical protein [Anaerolineales bacterium]